MSLKHLPNAPLVEATFELRFPGEPRVLAHIDEYYDAVREDFPEVFVPNAQAGIAPALQPWEFKKEDGSRWLGISINCFAVHVQDYLDYGDFRSLAIPLAEKFCEIFRIAHITKVGARYSNRIVLLRMPGEPIKLSNYLNLGFTLPETVDASTLEDIRLQFAIRREDAQLIIALCHVREYLAQPESLILDLDCGIVEQVSSDKFAQYLDKVHSYIEDLFAALAADSYLRYMKGETA
ncbi:MAG TPA: TIGR04255 family protein [Armatimonadota bacterium]|nr:TIGR04255 family protein [Armatimonadota bacterium]